MQINEKLLPIKANRLLWTDNGSYMGSNQTATLSEKVSEQEHGIVLHWQAFVSGTTRNYNHEYTFVPKQHIIANDGAGIDCHMGTAGFGYIATKYVYVYDTKIVGNDDNTKTGTGSGISYNNKYWVLTQVIGV